MHKRQFGRLRKCHISDHRVIYALLGFDILILRISNQKGLFKNKVELIQKGLLWLLPGKHYLFFIRVALFTV